MTELAAAPPAKLGATDRRDAWWVGPLATFLGLSAFVVYSTFRAIYNADYEVGSLLSPLYSPLLVWDDMPSWLSPSFLVLWAPGGFRLTCYYYRKAYYRSFALDPPACAVGEPKGRRYHGETRLLILQNLHRYFLYLALVFMVILTVDVIHACIWPDGFGISVGTLVLAASTTLLGLYTFSCHSFRHLVGGKIDCFSCARLGRVRHKAWRGISLLNEQHMLYAWMSLFLVGFADFYVWMAASGRITDVRLF